MKERNSVRRGVFADRECAVFDRVDLSLTEPVKPQPWGPLILKTKSEPSFGKDSFFGRYCGATFVPTGNPIQLRYSKMTLLPRVPQAMLRMDSENSPISAAELSLASRTLTGCPDAARLTYVEIAWDLYEDYDDVDRHLVSARTHHRSLFKNPENGRRTHYFGGRRSERYVSLYTKTPDIIRLEIRLRSRALRRLQINHPDELVLLRKVDFTDLVSISELRIARFVEDKWRRAAWRHLAYWGGLDLVAKDFAACFQVPRGEFLRPARLDGIIRDMQAKLVC